MFYLVFFLKSKLKCVVSEEHLLGGKKVNEVTSVRYGKMKYDAVILKKGDDEKYLDSLSVGKDGRLLTEREIKEIEEREKKKKLKEAEKISQNNLDKSLLGKKSVFSSLTEAKEKMTDEINNQEYNYNQERSPILSSRSSMHTQKKLRNDDAGLSDNSKLKIIQKDSILGKNKSAKNQQSIASAASEKIESESIDELPERSNNTGPSFPKGKTSAFTCKKSNFVSPGLKRLNNTAPNILPPKRSKVDSNVQLKPEKDLLPVNTIEANKSTRIDRSKNHEIQMGLKEKIDRERKINENLRLEESQKRKEKYEKQERDREKELDSNDNLSGGHFSELDFSDANNEPWEESNEKQIEPGCQNCHTIKAAVDKAVFTLLETAKELENASGITIMHKDDQLKGILPAYKNRRGAVEIKPKSGLFIDKLDLADIMRFHRRPREMVRRFMLHLIGKDILTKLVPKGNKNKAGIPSEIRATVYWFVNRNADEPIGIQAFNATLTNQCTTLRNEKSRSKVKHSKNVQKKSKVLNKPRLETNSDLENESRDDSENESQFALSTSIKDLMELEKPGTSSIPAIQHFKIRRPVPVLDSSEDDE